MDKWLHPLFELGHGISIIAYAALTIVEQIIKLAMTWDATKLIRRNCNTACIRKYMAYVLKELVILLLLNFILVFGYVPHTFRQSTEILQCSSDMK